MKDVRTEIQNLSTYNLFHIRVLFFPNKKNSYTFEYDYHPKSIKRHIKIFDENGIEPEENFISGSARSKPDKIIEITKDRPSKYDIKAPISSHLIDEENGNLKEYIFLDIPWKNYKLEFDKKYFLQFLFDGTKSNIIEFKLPNENMRVLPKLFPY